MWRWGLVDLSMDQEPVGQMNARKLVGTSEAPGTNAER